jgi:hypothetical protein
VLACFDAMLRRMGSTASGSEPAPPDSTRRAPAPSDTYQPSPTRRRCRCIGCR